MDIIDRLNIKSNMIFLGERIAFGSECELMDEAADEIESLRAQLAECQWISVNDRLPELHRRVLVKGDSTFVAGLQEVDSISADWGIRGELYWGLVNDVWENLDTTTHWMPLPQPPKAMSEKG